VDLQPSSLLPPVSVCNRLELHDRVHHPCRSRCIPHSVACCEDTGDHEPNILPGGRSDAPLPPQPRDRSRTGAHPSRREYLCHYESFHRRPYWISFLDNESDSRLRHSRLPHSLSRLRPGTGRTELSVLGRAIFRRSDLDRLVSDPPSVSLRKSKAFPRGSMLLSWEAALEQKPRKPEYTEDRIFASLFTVNSHFLLSEEAPSNRETAHRSG